MKTKNGFTLTELLITLSIASILGMISVPSLNKFIIKYRVNANLNLLRHALALTRYSAINSGKMSTLCATKDRTHCGKKWEEGYMLFIDDNANHLRESNEKLIQVFDQSSHLSHIKWKAFQRKRYLQYRPTGITNHQNGTFTFCPMNESNLNAKAIFITRPGRVRISEDFNNDGIDEGANGKDLNCSL